MRTGLTYVLAFRAAGDEDIDELAAYLKLVVDRVDELIVVNGSEDPQWQEHDDRWGSYCTHLKPRPDLNFLNGKVDGVITGLEAASSEKVVVADDDVRYDAASLARLATLLDSYDLVIPQNYFAEYPWHALWDAGRSLLNRALARDFPGTLGVRRATFMQAGGYDGDVMFENLEMIRTIEAAGGRVCAPLDLLVERRPPEAGRFFSQRVRQAYDEFALPGRLMFFLSIVPAVALVSRTGKKRWLGGAVGATVLLAEFGRRRGGGTRVFPVAASLMAPLWLLERGVCMWLALLERVRGGIPYRGRRIPVAAHSRRTIAARLPYLWARSRL